MLRSRSPAEGLQTNGLGGCPCVVVVAARRDKEWLAATMELFGSRYVACREALLPAIGAPWPRVKGKSEIVDVLSTSGVDNVVYKELVSLKPTGTTSFFTVRSVVF
jgi:hypothetical protein